MKDVQLLQVKGVMTVHPTRIRADTNLRQAAEVVAMSGASDLMVVDDDNIFIGVLSEGDIIRAALPNVGEIVDEGGTLGTAFSIFLNKGKDLANLPISPLIIQAPIVVDPDDHVAKAASVLIDMHIRLLPVVSDGRLVGTVSRADICRAVVGMV